ncbi:integrase, catalytic region, zinc finger, CCHC-type containing protein [Tanacetum coccineum]
MSTSKSYQQSLVDASSETRPPMLERGSYIPWAIPKLQTPEDLQGDALLHYDAEIKLMNLIILSIPNDIYNSMNACTSTRDMWKRVERMMRGSIQNKVDRETHFTNEFDQFVAEPGEALVSVYNLFGQLMNDLERNDMHFPIQFDKLVNVSRVKKLEKSHDPLALIAHTGSSSKNTPSYYVTHPTYVVDYDDEYQQDEVHTNSEDPLTSAMLLLARAITQNFSNPTNNRLRTSSNTRNQAIIQGDRVNIQSRNLGNTGRNNRRAYVQEEVGEGSNAPNETRNVQRTLRTSSSGNTSIVQCYNCSGKGHYARNFTKPRVRDSKYFMEQMLLAKQDEAGVILTDEQNDFLFADASRMEEIEELSANICLMARIQSAENTSDDGPSYDSAFISENVNSGSVEKDMHVPDLCALEQLARNAYPEAEKQQIFAQKVQKQNTTLTSQLELYKERVRVLETINEDNNYLNEFLEADQHAKHFSQQAQSQFVRDRDIIRDLERQREKLELDVKDFKRENEELQKTHLILKRQMSEKEDSYHDTILDLEDKLKKNVDLILKLGNSLQGMFMLRPKPFAVLGNSKISLEIRDTEDTLDDASKSQQKVYDKMNDPIEIVNKQNGWTIDYTKINALYQDFVPQKELSTEQTYFPSSIILSDKNSNATPSIPRDIKEMKDVFEYTESELCEIEKQNDFLKDQLLEVSLKHEIKLCVRLNNDCVDNSLHDEIEQIQQKSIETQEGLQARIKILVKDVQRCEKQSVEFELKLQHEKEKHKWDSILKNKNTNPLYYSWISKMEKLEDENVSLDFKVQSLIKERDNVKLKFQKLFNSIKNTRTQTQKEIDELIAHVSEKMYEYGAIRAENQNLLCTISELKSRLENVEKGKFVNTKFDMTNGSQTLLCVTPLNKEVIQTKKKVLKLEENLVVSKPVTLQTSPVKQRRANLNKNVIAPGIVRRPKHRDLHVKNSGLANSKKSAKKVEVYVRKNKQTDDTSKHGISDKENVIDADVANASKAKTLLCVSCMQNVLIPCRDKCLVNYRLNVHSNVHRTLSTNSRTLKSSDTTFVVLKTRFSEKSTQSKTLETPSVVSKTKIDVGSASHVVQIVLWIVDSGCSKHMTGDHSLLRNFVEKFMGTVCFGNDNFAAITCYGDYIQGNITICHVYYVEGLGHNLFSVGQLCDGDLEVAFRSKTCYMRNLEGDDLLTGGCESNLYIISISDMAASSPVCLMSKATLTKSWLWHRRLSHLNFGTINDLTKLDLVNGLPKFKYKKDHLCSACERGKSKKASHQSKLIPSDHSKLELLHMDLCGPMRVASINEKKYILVIMDNYSRYTWVYFLHSKDETPDTIKKFIAQA